MYVSVGDWISTIEGEYLRDFVTLGGAAVKFAVVPTRAVGTEARDGLERVARAADCQVAVLDAAVTKLHMVDQLFFAVARQIDWDGLAQALLRRLLAAEGFALPPAAAPLDYRAVAELNDYHEGELRRDVRLLLTNHVYRDYAMAQEFRIAMVRLC